jgi:hypothetical protein
MASCLAASPLAPDPLAGLWYPLNWILLLAPVPLTFNILLALHLAWAGQGVYAFLRAEGLNGAGALLGGAAFAGAPKLFTHLLAGHVSLVFAVAWTPWLLLAVRRAAGAGGWTRGALAGALLALIFLADPRWGFTPAFWRPRLADGSRQIPPRPQVLAAGGFVLFLALFSRFGPAAGRVRGALQPAGANPVEAVSCHCRPLTCSAC